MQIHLEDLVRIQIADGEHLVLVLHDHVDPDTAALLAGELAGTPLGGHVTLVIGADAYVVRGRRQLRRQLRTLARAR